MTLSQCPDPLKALDPNAELFWPLFLKRTGLHIDARGNVIEEIGHRADIIRNLGIPSLAERLAVPGLSERQRARIWWRESLACSHGDSDIPDLPDPPLALNAFIVTRSEKFRDARIENLSRNGRPRKSDQEKRAVHAIRQQRYRERHT